MADGVLPAVSFAKRGQWGGGASRGAQKTLPCNCLCPPSFPKGPESSEPPLGRAQLDLAAGAGGGPVDPSTELCLSGGLPGTDAKEVPVGVKWGECLGSGL